MTDKLLFSIIIPAYNAEKTIGNCLRSIEDICFDAYEIIVVNDGSSDATGEIVAQHIADGAPIFLVKQANQGVYRSRRNGAAFAHGEYCIFVDADDLVEENLFDALLPVVEKAPDMVVFDVAIAGDKRLCPEGWLAKLDLETAKCESVAGHLMNSIWNKCIRRDVFLSSNEHDTDMRLEYGEDAIQVAEVLDCCKSVVGLNKPLYCYVENETSVTSTIDSKKRFNQGMLKQKILYGYLIDWNLENACLSGFNSNCLIYCADYCKQLAENNDAAGVRELGATSFFRKAYSFYDSSLLTFKQRILMVIIGAKTLVPARFLCFAARIGRERV